MEDSRGTGSVSVLPPPRPNSPPEYPDLYGKRRKLAKIQILEREIGFLEGCGIHHIKCRSSYAYVRIESIHLRGCPKVWRFYFSFQNCRPHQSSCIRGISACQSFCLHFICFLSLCFYLQKQNQEKSQTSWHQEMALWSILFQFVWDPHN